MHLYRLGELNLVLLNRYSLIRVVIYCIYLFVYRLQKLDSVAV